MRDAKPGRLPTKFLVQAQTGMLRPYIAPHQVDEVREHIIQVAGRTKVDPARALKVFEERYLPALWQADVGSSQASSMFAVRVTQADPKDGAIAQLAVLLGVRVVTANKRHFGEPAVDEWFTVVSAYASVGLMDGTNASIAVSARLSGEGAVATGRAIKRGFDYLAEHPKVALGVAVVVLILVVGAVVYLSDEKRRERAWAAAQRIGPPVMRFAGRALQAYADLAGVAIEAEAVILASKLPRESLTLEQRLAEYLGSSRYPVPLEVMVQGLSPGGRRLIERELRSKPMFVLHDEGWTLGRRCVPAA